MRTQRVLNSVFVSLLAVLCTANVFAADPYLHEGPILLRNVPVIDGLGHGVHPMRDVLISDGRIAKTSVSGLMGDLPENTRVIDGTGMTAMPGLIDLHVHTGHVSFKPNEFEGRDPAGVQKTLNAQLYAGVTTVFDMGNDHDHIIGLRDDIAAGKKVGPEIVPSGRTIGSLESVSDVRSVTRPEAKQEIKKLLDERESAGIEMIKLYAGLSNWSARHIVAEAHKRNMRAVADFWCSNMGRTVFRVTNVSGFAHGTCHQITAEDAEWMRDNDKFAILTLTLFDNMSGNRQYPDYATRSFAKNSLIVDPLGKETINDYYAGFRMIRERFEDGEEGLYQSQRFPDLKQLLADNQANAMTLREAGVLVGMGTDAAFPPGTWPGEAMHRELELHVEAGIPPLEAIMMATHNGARILKMEDEIGALVTGMQADILVVRGDPSTNITATRNVEYVIVNGKLVDRKALVAD